MTGFNHDIPFSKGAHASNVICLPRRSVGTGGQKSDKIRTIAPWIFAGVAAVAHILKLSN